jgi:fatty acid desaturase
MSHPAAAEPDNKEWAEEMAPRGAIRRYDRTSVVEAARELSVPDNLGNALLIGRQWLMILGAAWLAVASGHWAVYAAAMIFIGTRMVVLGVLIHEAAHNHVFSKPLVNDVLSELFIGFPAGISIHLYRATHFWHHRALNTMEDPDYAFQRSDPDQHFPKSRAAFLWLTMKSALFVNFPQMARFAGKWWMPARFLFTPLARSPFPLWARILYVVWAGTVLGTLIATGYLLDAIILYLIPSLFWTNCVSRLRAAAEHGALPLKTELTSTRTVVPTLIDKWFVAPVGVCYHLEHHLFPYVPGRNLHKLHEVLMRDPAYRREAHVTYSYGNLIKELIKTPPREAGAAA